MHALTINLDMYTYKNVKITHGKKCKTDTWLKRT